MTPATRPITRVDGSSHRVQVVAVPDGALAVDGSAVVDTVDGTTTIEEVRSSLTVTVPEGTDVLVGVSSGRVEFRGHVGRAAVVTQSGRVSIESAESVDVRSASGRVEVGQVAGSCLVNAESGRVVIGACGSAEVSTANGRVEVAALAGPARIHSVAGRIELDVVAANDVEAETVSGQISIVYPRGTRIHRLDRTGVAGPRPADTDCVVSVRSVSGRIEVTTR